MSPQNIFLKTEVIESLGYSKGEISESIEFDVDKALEQIKEVAHFRYRSLPFGALAQTPFFLTQNEYKPIGDKISESVLFAATLGHEVDRAIKKYSSLSLSKALIMNTVANILLEAEVERVTEHNQSLFCPGYSGTDLKDNKQILDLLDAKKYLGIHTTDSGMMIPEKSMAGLLLKEYKFTCKGCLMVKHCEYLKSKTTCYTKK